MKLQLLLLVQMLTCVVHPPTPTFTITKDENADAVVALGGTALLTPFTVSDLHPDSHYVASIEYATNGEPIPNLPETQFQGIDDLNRYLRNNFITDTTGKPRDIQVVLRVMRPKNNLMVVGQHQLSLEAPSAIVPAEQALPVGSVVEIPSEAAIEEPMLVTAVPEMGQTTLSSTPSEEHHKKKVGGCPFLNVMTSHDNSSADVKKTAHAEDSHVKSLATAHNQVSITEEPKLDIMLEKTTKITKKPIKVFKIPKGYENRQFEVVVSGEDEQLKGARQSIKNGFMVLEFPNLTKPVNTTVAIKDKAANKDLMILAHVQFVKNDKKVAMIVFALSVLSLLIFLAAIIFDRISAKRKAAAASREQTLNSLMNPVSASRTDKDTYQL